MLTKQKKGPGSGIQPQGVSYTVIPWEFQVQENPFAVQWNYDMVELNKSPEKVVFLERENSVKLEARSERL